MSFFTYLLVESKILPNIAISLLTINYKPSIIDYKLSTSLSVISHSLFLPNKARKIKRDRELRERKREREDPI
jgi:hypothetical protein